MVTKLIKPAAAADVQDVRDKTAPAGAQPDLVAGLDALIGEAGAREEEGAAQQQRVEEKQGKQELEMLEADVLDTLKFIAMPAQKLCWWLTPEQFEQLWGTQTQRAMAEPLAAIMKRNGWDVKGLMTDYGPYAALAIAAVPPAVATVKVYREAKAWKNSQKPEAPDGHEKAS